MNMDEEARHSGDAVQVAELVWAEEYLAAVTLLRALAEKGQAAEAAGWAAKILRALPEYKAYLIDVLALNLNRIDNRPCALDEGYRRYIEILYRSAAGNLDQSGFYLEGKALRQRLEEFCSGRKAVVASMMCEEAGEKTDVAAVETAEDVAGEQLNQNDAIDMQEFENTEYDSLADSEGGNFVTENNDGNQAAFDILCALDEAEPVVMTAPGKHELPEAATVEILPDTQAPLGLAVENAMDTEAAALGGEQVNDFDDKININNILNINSDEIDEHFEKIKQVTAEAVKKAEHQVQRLKNKIHGSPKTSQTVSRIKETVRQASAKSVRKMSDLAPSMHKLKGLAGKFKLKKNNAQD